MLVSTLFVLLFIVNNAQIINIEQKRLGVSDNGWHGNINFNLKYTQNTRKIWEFGNKAAFQYHKNKSNYLMLTDLKIVRNDNQDLINKGFAHFRYNRMLKDSGNISTEVFSQVQYNGVQKIKFRSLNGAGFRFKILGNDTINLNLGIAVMYEYEETAIHEFHRNVRGSNYISFNWQISPKLSFKTINYYQPLLNLLWDFRFSNVSSLSFPLTKKLSFVASYNVLYDSNPVEGIPNMITSINNALRFKF